MDAANGVPFPMPGGTRRALLRGALGAGGLALLDLLTACGGAATVATAGGGTATSAAGSTAAGSVSATAGPAVTSTSAFASVSMGPSATAAAATATAPAATASAAATSATPASSAAAARAITVAALARQDALKYWPEVELKHIDPATALIDVENGVVLRVFSNLLAFDADGALAPEMAAALPAVSADGLTYSVTLRDGLTYSDGTPLTARDFEYAWKRFLDPAVASPNAALGFAIEGAREYRTADPKQLPAADLQQRRDAVGVRASDDATLVFTLREPASWFPSVLATYTGVPVRRASVEAGGADWARPATYVGNGPYVLQTWEPGRQMVFAANPRYYRGAPPVATVQYLAYPDSAAAFAAYRAEALDVYHFFAPSDFHTIEADPALSQQKEFTVRPACFLVAFNCAAPPFADVRVRRAFSLAIDRQDYNHRVMGDLNLPADQLVPPGLPGHEDGLPAGYQRSDPEQAKRLLAEAGYGADKPFPELRLAHDPVPILKLRANALADRLRQVLGVPITVLPDDGKLGGAWAMHVDGIGQDYPDAQDWYSLQFASATDNLNTGWKHAQYDALCRQADREADAAKRAALYKQAAQLLNDEAPAAFVVWYRLGNLVKPRISGHRPDPTEYYFGQRSLMAMRYRPPA